MELTPYPNFTTYMKLPNYPNLNKGNQPNYPNLNKGNQPNYPNLNKLKLT
jgi:hypothetical protein